ncbi:S8 family serine peptidase [Flavobacterium sp. FlaQc-52]|uniref:S8 family peptidase n=1 Tax=Flavobacterium sp. FlaQc-52 TaxID=3374185 RepID=UPI003756C05F
MSQTFQLYLTADPILQQECITTLNAKFQTDVEPWYSDPKGNFKYFFRLKTSDNKNKWRIAKEIKDAHKGVIEVDPVIFLTGQTGAYESDEDYPEPGNVKWNHSITKFPEAIQKSVSDGKLDINTGTVTRIAHFDTGITKHPELPDFKERGYNFVEENDDITDMMNDGLFKHPGHGTGTASVIVGLQQTENNDFNNGVFPYTSLIPYRIAKSVVHFVNSNIDEAILHAVKKGVDVITMSMGGAPPRRSWKEAVKFAYDNGVIFCCAAGNNVQFVVWPAAYDEVLAIAAINVNKEPWEGSCRGNTVDASAPGENVYVARSKKDNTEMIFDQGFGSGTSFAVPHVAAAAVLWLNHFKDEIAEAIEKPSDKVDLFRTALKLSVQPHKNNNYTTEYGPGILDAYKLLDFSPKIIKQQYPDEYQKSKSISRQGRGFGNAGQEYNLIQKEMLDLMVNKDHVDYSSMIEFIREEATPDAKNAFDNLMPLAPAPAQNQSSEGTRAMKAEELNHARALFATEIIAGNF